MLRVGWSRYAAFGGYSTSGEGHEQGDENERTEVDEGVHDHHDPDRAREQVDQREDEPEQNRADDAPDLLVDVQQPEENGCRRKREHSVAGNPEQQRGHPEAEQQLLDNAGVERQPEPVFQLAAGAGEQRPDVADRRDIRQLAAQQHDRHDHHDHERNAGAKRDASAERAAEVRPQEVQRRPGERARGCRTNVIPRREQNGDRNTPKDKERFAQPLAEYQLAFASRFQPLEPAVVTAVTIRRSHGKKRRNDEKEREKGQLHLDIVAEAPNPQMLSNEYLHL